MTYTRQTLHDAVSTAMKHAVWVKPGQSPSDDVYYVAMAGMEAPQIGPDYDCEHEAGKACYALNVDAAIAAMLDRLRKPSDALFEAVMPAIGDNIRLEWHGHNDASIHPDSILDAAAATFKAMLDAFEKERSDGQ